MEELLNKYSEFLEKNGYIDTDWREETPTAIERFIAEDESIPVEKPVKPANGEELVNQIRQLLAGVTGDERIEIINKIKEGYCHSCGDDNPYCQCWNDE